MELPEGISVRDRNKRDILVFHVLVEVAFDIHADGAGALVEDCVLWFVIDEAAHSHSLLLTT